MSEWDVDFSMYCGQEWKTDDDHTHECRRSPGHSTIESWHASSGTSRVDHWCYCGSKLLRLQDRADDSGHGPHADDKHAEVVGQENE